MEGAGATCRGCPVGQVFRNSNPAMPFPCTPPPRRSAQLIVRRRKANSDPQTHQQPVFPRFPNIWSRHLIVCALPCGLVPPVSKDADCTSIRPISLLLLRWRPPRATPRPCRTRRQQSKVLAPTRFPAVECRLFPIRTQQYSTIDRSASRTTFAALA